ncbi:MAG TPA: tyrosine-type recombinase/integrase [Stellaceae bacterium]|nr:tyrosine-type recombinase/integrase [Stellaceae bacterium]
MRPYVICHMNTSVDGRIWHSRWRPAANRDAGLFERIHQELGNGSWLIGRVTGSEYAKAKAYPAYIGETFPREPWFVRRDAAAYGIALDARGKIAWGRSDIGGDPIVAVLTKQVSDAHLAGLHRDGVSYIFAGERELDLRLALEILNRELGIERLLLEGGGKSNGSFLRVARPWPGRRRRSCIILADGSPYPPDKLSRDWLRIATSRKLPRVMFHALRHSQVSALIAAGLDIVAVSRRIGHASPAVTLAVYAHLFESKDDAAAAAIEAAMRPRG